MLRVLLSAALVAMIMAGPAHARFERFEPPPSGVFEFVGFSIGTVDGAAGILGMHSTCQADFGPDSRMCTVEEYWRSPSAASPGLTPAWLHPGGVVFLRSAVTGDCRGWSSTDSSGAVVRENVGLGNIVQVVELLCDIARPVTCCARLK